MWDAFACAGSASPPVALRLHAAKATWTADVVLEACLAVVAVIVSARTLFAVGSERRLWRRLESLLFVLFGLAAIAFDAHEVDLVRTSDEVHAFLTGLLVSLPKGCDSVRLSVFYARLIGETPGIVLGVAMTSLAAFVDAPSAPELAARMRRLEQLLYLASLLFVSGIMVSRANFSLILSHWVVIKDDDVSKAIGEVIKAGVLQSGVGYSALLAAFFLPVRLILAYDVESSVPEFNRDDDKERRTWLRRNGLSGSWQKDARQLLALLAPVLSAPVFDAIAKP